MTNEKKLVEYIDCLADSARGVYIPKHFVDSYDMRAWGVNPMKKAILSEGPDHEDYWEVWEDVLEIAHLEAKNGADYHLECGENGDLFMVLDGYSLEDDPDTVIPPEVFHLSLINRLLKNTNGHGDEFAGFELKHGFLGWYIEAPTGECLYHTTAKVTDYSPGVWRHLFNDAKAAWLCPDPNYYIDAVDYHRNGCSGEGFYTVTFRHIGDEATKSMGAILFPYERDADGWGNCKTAVFSTDTAGKGNLRFFDNSFRGDYFSPTLEAVVAKWNAYETFRSLGKWHEDPANPPNPLVEETEEYGPEGPKAPKTDADTERALDKMTLRLYGTTMVGLPGVTPPKTGDAAKEIAEIDFAAAEEKVLAKMIADAKK